MLLPSELTVKYLAGNGWASNLLRTLAAITVSVLLFPFGLVATAIFLFLLYPRTLLPSPPEGGDLKESRQFFKNLGQIFVVLLGTLVVAFAVLGQFDLPMLAELAQAVRMLAGWSILPNQLELDLQNQSLMSSSDEVVVRSYIAWLAPVILLSWWGPRNQRGVRIVAGDAKRSNHGNKGNGFMAFSFLLCVAFPFSIFVAADKYAANAGKIPRHLLLAGPSIVITVICFATLIGANLLWASLILKQEARRQSSETATVESD